MLAPSTASSRYCPRCGTGTDAEACPQDGTPTFLRTSAGTGVDSIQPGDLIDGRYRIVSTLGTGGFGAVFAAEHVVTGQACAVKVMTTDQGALPADAIQRFLQEARVTASLARPNTVRIYDFGQTGSGVLFMAMERLRGPTLESLIDDHAARGTALTEAQAIDIGVQVCRSMTEAHAAGLVHRDLKPANLILARTQPDEPWTVKVLDFGIARTHDSSLTQAGTALGTPHFMSPEQGRGEVPDGRCDLYALGCILFACVAGKPPFDDPAAMAILVSHQLDPLPNLRLHAKVPVSEAFVQVVEKATAKRREDRYPTARAMREALEAVHATRPAALTGESLETVQADVLRVPSPQAAAASGGVTGAPPGGMNGSPSVAVNRAASGGPNSASPGGGKAAPSAGGQARPVRSQPRAQPPRQAQGSATPIARPSVVVQQSVAHAPPLDPGSAPPQWQATAAIPAVQARAVPITAALPATPKPSRMRRVAIAALVLALGTGAALWALQRGPASTESQTAPAEPARPPVPPKEPASPSAAAAVVPHVVAPVVAAPAPSGQPAPEPAAPRSAGAARPEVPAPTRVEPAAEPAAEPAPAGAEASSPARRAPAARTHKAVKARKESGFELLP